MFAPSSIHAPAPGTHPGDNLATEVVRLWVHTPKPQSMERVATAPEMSRKCHQDPLWYLFFATFCHFPDDEGVLAGDTPGGTRARPAMNWCIGARASGLSIGFTDAAEGKLRCRYLPCAHIPYPSTAASAELPSL